MKHCKYSVYYRKEVQGPFECIDNSHCSMQKSTMALTIALGFLIA